MNTLEPLNPAETGLVAELQERASAARAMASASEMSPHFRQEKLREGGLFERTGAAIVSLRAELEETRAERDRWHTAALDEMLGGAETALAALREEVVKVLDEARSQLYGLCEATQDECAEIAQRDVEGKSGAYARGRKVEAKGIARAMGEVFAALRSRLLEEGN